MLIAHNLLDYKKYVLIALCAFLALSQNIFAGSLQTNRESQRDNPSASRENQSGVTDDTDTQSADGDEASDSQTLDENISAEERLRLRRDLDEYARSTDPDHVQIQEQRRLMRQRIQERFMSSDKDNDGSISREEAAETLPQIARHFSQVDLNNDGVITLNELEAAQARAIERQRAATAKNEVQDPDPVPKNKKNKDATNSRKRSL